MICELCGREFGEVTFIGTEKCPCGAIYTYDEGVRLVNARQMVARALVAYMATGEIPDEYKDQKVW